MGKCVIGRRTEVCGHREVERKRQICMKNRHDTEDRQQKTEDRRPKTDDRRQKAQKTEDRRQMTQEIRQKLKDRRQKTEDRRLKTEDRRRTVSYTHHRAHETVLDLVCRILLA